jgi:2-polyprenyl-3-methyl-5-hydroxy-6-metoxy-1,4-benzoquinol methylase
MQVITSDISRYDKDWWEEFYSRHTHVYNDEEQLSFKAAKQEIGDKSVIDVGCGEGYFSNFCDNYFGIDWSEQAIKKAETLYPDKRFLAGDIGDVLDKFDYALLSMVFEHLENPQEYIKKIKKIAKKVIIIIPNGQAGKICVDNDKSLISAFSEHTDYHYATYDTADILEMYPEAKILGSWSTVLVFVV